MPVGYPRKTQVWACGSNLDRWVGNEEANARQPKTLNEV